MALFDIPEDKRRDINAAVARTQSAPSGGWDPGRGESWWWLGLPIAASIALIVTYRIDEAFYRAWILPEGYGVLEVAQFVLALTGFLIAIRLAFKPYVRSWRLLFLACCVFAAACLFIAGEEHSWGQHFFKWSTPEYWAQINRQQETNLHNSFRALNHFPQLILEIGILIGGLLMPLYQAFAGRFTDPILRLFAPPAALVPTALCVLFFKIAKRIGDKDPSLDIVGRPSEALEVFFYLFIAFYMIVFARRVMLMENAGSTKA